MSISMITATYNCAVTVGDCLDAVAGQSFADREHLVIDGASMDGTRASLEARRAQLAVLVSEPDRGLYGALNKGLARATGEVVGVLHPQCQDRSRLPWEGDLLARRHALYQAAKAQHADRGSGPTRNWEPATKVLLNPGNPLKTEDQTDATTA